MNHPLQTRCRRSPLSPSEGERVGERGPSSSWSQCTFRKRWRLSTSHLLLLCLLLVLVLDPGWLSAIPKHMPLTKRPERGRGRQQETRTTSLSRSGDGVSLH